MERSSRNEEVSGSDLAQKKFGSAKAISSAQFFNDNANDNSEQDTLNRFQGSTSISSAEYFGRDQGNTNLSAT